MDLIETQTSQLHRALNDTVHVAAVGYLDLCVVSLTKAQVALSPTTPLATLQAAEADYTGYAAGVITWQTPTTADDQTVEVVGTVPVFRPTDAVAPNNVWDVFITNAGGTLLFFLGQFDNAPLPMVSALDQILLTIRYRPATNSMVVVIS